MIVNLFFKLNRINKELACLICHNEKVETLPWMLEVIHRRFHLQQVHGKIGHNDLLARKLCLYKGCLRQSFKQIRRINGKN